MAILSKSDLPSIVKIRTEPMKKYVLSRLGFPVVDVEITEDQWETLWRVASDFIAGYFPREQRLAVFYTSPLKSTYPLPDDAYWIQEVSWDPVTTRIDDVFGAESFLFCLPSGAHLLTTSGSMQVDEVAQRDDIKLVTPFGPRKPDIQFHNKKQPVTILETDKDYVICTPNHPVNINNKFRMALTGFPGTKLLNSDDASVEIVDRGRSFAEGTWSVSTDSGCFYMSATGKEFYLVH